MKTIHGHLQDVLGNPVHCLVTFVSKSTPLAGSGIVTGNTTKTIRTNASTGEFTIALKAGNYSVTYQTSPTSTTFNIAVPDGDGVLDIDEVVTTALSYTYTPPNTVWNGRRAGHITFEPTATPPAPSSTVVDDPAGNMDTDGTYGNHAYKVSYVTASGETAVSSKMIASGVAANPGKSVRLALEVNPTGVTAKRIWRQIGQVLEDLGEEGQYYLLAEVAPGVAYYDDWESTLDFGGRTTALVTHKQNVKVATTANITLSGTQTIDDISVLAGDRVLVKNQTAAKDNGIYVAAAGAWSRAADADASAEVTNGLYVYVEQGDDNTGTWWILETADPIVLGTTALSFVRFYMAPAINSTAGQLVADDGLPVAQVTRDGLDVPHRLLLPDIRPLFEGAPTLPYNLQEREIGIYKNANLATLVMRFNNTLWGATFQEVTDPENFDPESGGSFLPLAGGEMTGWIDYAGEYSSGLKLGSVWLTRGVSSDLIVTDSGLTDEWLQVANNRFNFTGNGTLYSTLPRARIAVRDTGASVDIPTSASCEVAAGTGYTRGASPATHTYDVVCFIDGPFGRVFSEPVEVSCSDSALEESETYDVAFTFTTGQDSDGFIIQKTAGPGSPVYCDANTHCLGGTVVSYSDDAAWSGSGTYDYSTQTGADYALRCDSIEANCIKPIRYLCIPCFDALAILADEYMNNGNPDEPWRAAGDGGDAPEGAIWFGTATGGMRLYLKSGGAVYTFSADVA